MKKRILFMLLAVAAICNCVHAEGFDSVFSHFKAEKRAEYVKVPSLLVRIAGGFSDMSKELEDVGLKGSVSGVRVLDMSGCDSTQIEEFRNEVMNAGKELDLLMRAGGKENVRIWGKTKGNKIKKVYIFADQALVEISGNFRAEKK